MSRNVRNPRGRRGAAAGLTALVAVLILAWGTAEAISLALHRHTFWLAAPDVAQFGRHTDLSNTVVLIVAIVVFAFGMLMILAALIPPRRALVELEEQAPTVASGLTRRSFRRTLAAAAVEVDGVSAAKVTGRRRLKVTATTALREVSALPDLVRERVDSRLHTLDPIPARTVRIRLDRRNS